VVYARSWLYSKPTLSRTHCSVMTTMAEHHAIADVHCDGTQHVGSTLWSVDLTGPRRLAYWNGSVTQKGLVQALRELGEAGIRMCSEG
jgi:hypothetical protein